MVQEWTLSSGGTASSFGRGSSYLVTEIRWLFESIATKPVDQKRQDFTPYSSAPYDACVSNHEQNLDLRISHMTKRKLGKVSLKIIVASDSPILSDHE